MRPDSQSLRCNSTLPAIPCPYPGKAAVNTADNVSIPTTCTIKVADVPDWIDFPGAAQVAQLRRTVTTAAAKTVEVVYLITSADHKAAPPQRLAAWVQGHWGIEVRLHWVRDVTFGKDGSQAGSGQAPRIMATCRNTAISILRIDGWENIAAGLRHHARHPDHALALVLTS